MSDVKVDSRRLPAQRGKAVKLHVWQRLVSAGAAIGLGYAALFAVLHKGMEGAAVVAILVVALVLGLLAIIGHIPYRLWGKDMGVEWGDTRFTEEAADAIADAVPSERREELVSVIEQPTSAAGVRIMEDPKVHGSGTGEQTFHGVTAILRHSLLKANKFEAECRQYVYYEFTTLSRLFEPGTFELMDGGVQDPTVGDLAIKSSYGLAIIDFKVSLSARGAQQLVSNFANWRMKHPGPSRLLILTEVADELGASVTEVPDAATECYEIVTLPYRVDRQGAVTRAVRRTLESLKAETEAN